MRSHEEVVERLKAKNKEYVANRRKRITRIAGILSVVALIGLSIPIYQKLGKNTRPQTEPTVAPTEGVTANPTGEVEPVEKDKPTVTVTPTVSLEGRNKADIELTGEGPVATNEEEPRPGTIYISKTLRQMIQDNPGKDDVLYSVILTIEVSWSDSEITAFIKDFRDNCEWNPLYVQYKEEYSTWLLDEYMPYLSEKVEKKEISAEEWEKYCMQDWDVFSSVWKERHTEEEWEELQKIIKRVDSFDQDLQDIRIRLQQEELLLIQNSGMLTYCYPIEDPYRTSIGALITADQFENFLVSDRFSYHFSWSEAKDLGEVETSITGFIKAPPKEPVKPQNVIIIDGTDSRIDEKLQGEQDADEIVTICIIFGDSWSEGQRILREQYPKEYAAYMEMKESGEVWDNDDPRIELAERGWELHNSLPGDWEDEQEAKFFERHPEFLPYRQTDGVMSLYMHVPFSLIPEIAKDSAIKKISRVPEDKRKPEIIGEYQGFTVYDLQGTNENPEMWIEAVDE